ncbi:putative hydrolase of the HAD superfamily [Actinopolymorpha cephalotaxi]|uniref:Hydrolase of the HAD superfamily n=1 Tax=Actinopolymorpha cephalotaxi TaxID=504797 RepID=A0A1I2PPG7_9ACTN|nr:HAD family hydrolase [Actinopolymorpha cephalotaxi]NYH83612.1 putative hydrolase of the HAD superfamily [Actinopolymorpha cephalotaxi]SFG15331.1 putative hydrolase of the HAD superfamily [Actinopolymorpha cephalotaxi]
MSPAEFASSSPAPTTALLVDVGGVLLLPNAALLTPVVARHGGVSTEEEFLRAHYAAHNAAFPARGEPRDYYELLPRFAGVPAERLTEAVEDYRAVSRTRNMWHAPDPASKAALAGFVAEGVRVAIVSQADGRIARMLRDAAMCQEGEGPGVTVDAVLDSAVVGYDKPDPRFFRAALDAVGATRDRAVHVGDTVPADVRGAQAADILAVHYDPYGDCDDPGDHEHVRTLAEVGAFLPAPLSTP